VCAHMQVRSHCAVRAVVVTRHILNYLRNGCVVGVDSNLSLREELLLVSIAFVFDPSMCLEARPHRALISAVGCGNDRKPSTSSFQTWWINSRARSQNGYAQPAAASLA
jgi:hypothetical protein